MREKILTLHSIAGYAMEVAIWKMLCDVCKKLKNGKEKGEEKSCLSPGMIQIDGEDFCFVDVSIPEEERSKFSAPEIVAEKRGGENAVIWSLGALICYMSSGHYVFGGRGGVYQQRHPLVGLPVLRKEHEMLTDIVHRCMQYQPSERITLKELKKLSEQGYQKARERGFARVEENQSVSRRAEERECKQEANVSVSFWPEEM